MKHPKCYYLDVTPDWARDVLSRLRSNQRILDPVLVAQYVAMMLAGEWVCTNDAIVINWNGELDNGQHRLHAVVKSGVTVRMLIVEGADPDAILTYDRGKKRQLGDVLHMQGEPNARQLAAALQRAMPLDAVTVLPAHWQGLQIPAALAWLKKNPEIRKSTSVGRGVWQATHFGAGSAAALHYLMARDVDQDLSNTYWDEIKNGGTSRGTATYVIRERLIKLSLDVRMKPHVAQTEAMVVTGWRKWMTGRDDITNLIIPPLANPITPKWTKIGPLQIVDRRDAYGLDVTARPLRAGAAEDEGEALAS